MCSCACARIDVCMRVANACRALAHTHTHTYTYTYTYTHTHLLRAAGVIVVNDEAQALGLESIKLVHVRRLQHRTASNRQRPRRILTLSHLLYSMCYTVSSIARPPGTRRNERNIKTKSHLPDFSDTLRG